MAAKAFSYIRIEIDEDGNQKSYVREFKTLWLYLKHSYGVYLNDDGSVSLKDAIMILTLLNGHKYGFNNFKFSYSLHWYTNGEPDGN